MKIFKGKIDKIYKEVIKTLLNNSKSINDTLEIQNACLVINDPTLNNFSFPLREISEKYCNAELKWYWSADNSCETIGKYAKLWLNITDDGKTNNSAYGYILHKKYGIDQLKEVIDLLKSDPNSRRAVLNISDPALNKKTTKDMQCTIAIQFLIRQKQLDMTVYMRSNDIIFGLPYDYIYFTSLGLYVAEKLNLKLGTYTHYATSLHIYKKDICRLKPHKQILNIPYRKIIKENYEEQKYNNNCR